MEEVRRSVGDCVMVVDVGLKEMGLEGEEAKVEEGTLGLVVSEIGLKFVDGLVISLSGFVEEGVDKGKVADGGSKNTDACVEFWLDVGVIGRVDEVNGFTEVGSISRGQVWGVTGN